MYVKYFMAGFLVIYSVSMMIQFVSYCLSSAATLLGEAEPDADGEEVQPGRGFIRIAGHGNPVSHPRSYLILTMAFALSVGLSGRLRPARLRNPVDPDCWPDCVGYLFTMAIRSKPTSTAPGGPIEWLNSGVSNFRGNILGGGT